MRAPQVFRSQRRAAHRAVAGVRGLHAAIVEKSINAGRRDCAARKPAMSGSRRGKSDELRSDGAGQANRQQPIALRRHRRLHRFCAFRPSWFSISASATCSARAVAGNVVNTDIIGSLEYSTKVAGAKAIVVLGHNSCGAIKAAVDDRQARRSISDDVLQATSSRARAPAIAKQAPIGHRELGIKAAPLVRRRRRRRTAAR